MIFIAEQRSVGCVRTGKAQENRLAVAMLPLGPAPSPQGWVVCKRLRSHGVSERGQRGCLQYRVCVATLEVVRVSVGARALELAAAPTGPVI